jgi:hypothetical protein
LFGIKHRLPFKILLPLLAISIFSIASYAASVSVTQSNNQAVNGVYYNVAGGFTAASNGFQVVQASGPASSLPCTWSNGGTCQTALTAGDWEYSVTLTINAGAAASHTYTLTVQWNTGIGYTSLGTLTVTSPSTITAGQTMTFLIDTAGTSFSAPAGIIITVA